MFSRALFGVLVVVSLGFGQQIDSNSITVAVSRDAAVQPDQVVFGVTITSDIRATLSDVLPALQGTGITAENFVSVRTGITYPNDGSTPQPNLTWLFSITAPLSKLKEASAALNAAMQKSPMTLSVYISGTQVSPAFRESHPCSRSGLVADARIQAQKLADAGGLSLGPIVAITSVPPSCSMIVKFASPVSGQSDQNSLTVTATRAVNLQRDQIGFTVSVAAPVVTGLDEVVAALQGSGITASDLSGVFGIPPTWIFTRLVPISNMKDTTAALALLQQRLSGMNPPFAMSFSVDGPQAGSQGSQSCSPSDLVADARVEAQALAAASSRAVGQILGMSQAAMATSPTFPVIADFARNIPTGTVSTSAVGYFSVTSLINTYTVTQPPIPDCSITIKFRLIDNQ